MARSSRNSDWQRRPAAIQRSARQEAREAERERRLAEKQQREAYLERRAAEAASQTADLAEQMRRLGEVLADALRTPAQVIDFEALKIREDIAPLDLGDDAVPQPAISWASYEPRKPGRIARMLGGDARYARNLAAAERAYTADVERHDAAETARQQRVSQARRDHSDLRAAAAARVAAQHAAVDRFAAAVRAGERQEVSRYFQQVIDEIADSAGFPRSRRAGYVPESSLLALEWRLPSIDVVPDKKAIKYVKTRDALEAVPRASLEIRQTYQQLVAQIALRALRAVFGADPSGLVTTVVFNGIIEAIDPATGQNVQPCLITLRATRDQFASVVLSRVDPVACVRKYFAADVSPHPEELQAVQPVMSFDMADPRIIDPVDVISGLDKRPNLLDLRPKEFEHFVHNLFTRMGLDTKLFRADGDGGVDCIAYDSKPVFGGKYVIQAKLYNITVPPAAVRDLFGTMQHEGATKGILITTSGYGPSSYEFANGKPLQLIDGTGLLALCKTHHIPARIVPRNGKARK